MARLRIRVELSRGGAGVPLHKLASVIAASQKFLNFLSEDVHIDQHRGEWLAFDFDRESLNFTAEYVGAVTPAQVEDFNAAFDGTTSLRRDTIAQFLQITEAIGEDEVIGFGLYQADEADPTEWRCLSRRDALRIAEEVQVLMGSGEAPHLPAASDPGLAARMFGERRERAGRENRLADYVREVESGLSTRLERVESQVQMHSGLIEQLNVHSSATETSFRNLLSTFESFCNQATLNIERMSPLALPAPASNSASPRPVSDRSFPIQGPAARPARPNRSGIAIAGIGVVIAAGIMIGISLWPAHRTQPAAAYQPSAAPATVSAASVSTPAVQTQSVQTQASASPASASATQVSGSTAKPLASPSQPVARSASSTGPGMEVVLDATEPTWVSMKDLDGKDMFAQLLLPGAARTVKLQGGGVLRTGNAGGLVVRFNGAPIGPIGPSGKVREITFKSDGFTINSL